MSPRLYLDEDFIPQLARVLRTHGFDVISAHEVGNAGLPDDRQLEFAAREGRAILTCNAGDFSQLAERWSIEGRLHSGIIVSYRQYRRDELGALIRATVALLSEYRGRSFEGGFAVLTPVSRE